MIALDADVLLVDMRYGRDVRFGLNRQVLDYLRQTMHPLAITSHTLFEILGVSCFQLSTRDLLDLADQIPINYGLSVEPNSKLDAEYAGVAYSELLDCIATKFSIGDAVNALQLAKFLPQTTCFLSWNAKHFRGKLSIPALTPEEWWQQNQPTP